MHIGHIRLAFALTTGDFILSRTNNSVFSNIHVCEKPANQCAELCSVSVQPRARSPLLLAAVEFRAAICMGWLCSSPQITRGAQHPCSHSRHPVLTTHMSWACILAYSSLVFSSHFVLAGTDTTHLYQEEPSFIPEAGFVT